MTASLRSARPWYWVALGAYLGTCLLLLYWYGIHHPAAGAGYWLLLLPLLGLWPVFWRGQRYGIAVGLFIALIYFTHGVIEAWSNPGARPLALVEIGLSTLWFVAGILDIRQRRS